MLSAGVPCAPSSVLCSLFSVLLCPLLSALLLSPALSPALTFSPCPGSRVGLPLFSIFTSSLLLLRRCARLNYYHHCHYHLATTTSVRIPPPSSLSLTLSLTIITAATTTTTSSSSLSLVSLQTHLRIFSVFCTRTTRLRPNTCPNSALLLKLPRLPIFLQNPTPHHLPILNSTFAISLRLPLSQRSSHPAPPHLPSHVSPTSWTRHYRRPAPAGSRGSNPATNPRPYPALIANASLPAWYVLLTMHCIAYHLPQFAFACATKQVNRNLS